MSKLLEFLGAGWTAVTTGELPKAPPVSSDVCPICHGTGELPVDGGFVMCPEPRHRGAPEPRRGT